MSKWADIDAIIDMSISVLCGGGNEEMAVLVEDINSIPSIEIIRCRECKYWVSDGGALMLCDIHKDPTVPEHFCSYGSRSEKPNNLTTEDCSDVGKE